MIVTAPCAACVPGYMMLSVAATSLYGSSIHISAASGLDLHSIWNLSVILLCLLNVPVRAFRIHAFSLIYLQIMLACLHKQNFIIF